MDDPLESLVAKDQVIDCINRLFINSDNRDWPGVLACLAPTVELDMTSLAGGVPATLPAEQGLRPIQLVHHQAGNYDTRTFVGSYDIRLTRVAAR